METTPRQHHVLVTGSAGAIGRAVVGALRERSHAVRGFDRAPYPELENHIVGDLTDRDAVRSAVEGCDTVIHLAAHPTPADFIETLLGPNVIGLYHVVDAAREAGVKRLVLASSAQVIFGYHQRPVPTTVSAPLNHYALTKLWAEDLGAMASRCYGMTVIAARIGWVPKNPAGAEKIINTPGGRVIYLSQRDAGRFFVCAVEAELDHNEHPFVVAYAAGPGWDGRQHLDLEPSRRLLGYEPRDVFPDGLPFDVP